MRKHIDSLAKGIIFMLIITISVIVSMGIFIDHQNAKEVKNISTIYMESASKRISQYFATVLELHIGQAASMAKDSNSQDPSAVIKNIMHDTDIFGFDYVGFYYKDGSYEPLKGDTIEFVDPEPFMASLREVGRKAAKAVDPEGKNVVAMGVAADYTSMDKAPLALVAGFDADYFIDELSLNSDEVVFNTTIIMRDGSFVLRNSGEYSGNYFDKIKGLYDDAGADSETLLMPLREAIENDRAYVGSISFSGREEYIYCAKIPDSEWFMVTYLPYGSLNETVNALTTQNKFAEIFALSCVILAFAALQVLYSRVSRKQYEELEAAHNEALEAQSKLTKLAKLNEELSITDYLTHLPNRRGLNRYIDDHWKQWSSSAEKVAFLTLDIDNLKYINDTFGHEEGDWTISTFGEIVAEITADHGITARTGGDEFLAVLMVDAATAGKIAESIYARLDDINSRSSKPYELHASIGFYDTPIYDDTSYDECIRLSDEEMYRVKKQHRIEYSGGEQAG